jgi:transcriptional regulator with XRE-family HTH domain
MLVYLLPVMTTTQQERALLANFLRTRRMRVSPTEFGFEIGRRRTPGLRREEVAQIAGMSVTWYTWLEQGRDVQASTQVLERIAYALRLEPHETRYLLTLAKVAPEANHQPQNNVITPTIRQLIDHQGLYPAYVLGRYWDFLAWNTAANRLFGNLDALPDPQRHMVGYVFLRPETRSLLPDWEARAQAITAEFRADCSQYAADSYFNQMVESIRAASPDFERMWGRHDVRPRVGGQRTFMHPQVGFLTLEQVTLTVSNVPDIKVVVLMSAGDEEPMHKLRLLSADEQP